MNRNKKWIIASLILLAAGALVCGISYAALGFDFGKLNTIEYVTNTYDVNDDFQNICEVCSDIPLLTIDD